MEKTERSVHDCCRNYREIAAAYLFGSVAKGSSGPVSDLDVALILFYDNSERFDLLAFASDLEKKAGRTVDVVILNRAGEVLKREVRKYGRLLYEADPVLRKRFEIMSRKLFEDFLYLHNRYVQKVLYGA